MINMYEVSETNKMIEHENLDVRTITLGISLLDCIDSDLDQLNQNIYNKITTVAKGSCIYRTGYRKRIWNPDREQENFHYSGFTGWWLSL